MALLGLPPGRAHIRILPLAALLIAGEIALGVVGLPLLFAMNWFIPYVTPSALHRISLKCKMRKKKTHIPIQAESSSALTPACFFAQASVSAFGVLTDGSFIVSTHVDDPTTGVSTLGGEG